MRTKIRGSVTVFSALALMLVASFLFALLEAGRVYGLETYAAMTSQLGLESVCAEYQPGLWEDYRLLCLDGAYGGEAFAIENVTDALQRKVDVNLSTEAGTGNLFAMDLERAEPEEYQLLTDGEGTVFLKRTADYMKENLPVEIAQAIYEKYTEGSQVEESGQSADSIEDAQNAIEEAKESMESKETENEETEENSENGQKENGEPDTDGQETESMEDENAAVSEEDAAVAEPENDVENPLEIVLALKQNAILGMVVEDTQSLSTQKVDLSDSLLKRECERGTAGEEESVDWYEKVLALEYLDQYFSDYTSPAEGHAFSYELEYVLCGKEEDRANLEGAVNRLLLVREAGNVAHILSDSEKLNYALMIAEALAGFTGNPAIVKVVQIGIVGAWAYMESIQDVRALLSGDKIALIKSKDQWTVQVGNLLESFQSTSKAKNCTNGLSYQSYLKQFLFVMKDQELAYRMMDIMEQNIRLVSTYKNCRMDHMICQVTYRMEYGADPLFSGISTIGSLGTERLEFQQIKEFSY